MSTHKQGKFFLFLIVFSIACAGVFAANSRIAANESNAPGIDVKLEKILINQEQILKKLDDVSAELRIVKIRATR
jgi:hypothetical protein